MTPTGGEPTAPLHWSPGGADQALLLPAGSYDVVRRRDHRSEPVRLAVAVEVPEGELVELAEPAVRSW